MAKVVLTEAIRRAHKATDETYGMLCIRTELRDAGDAVNRKRVARLMRQARSEASVAGATRDDRAPATAAPDLANRQFRADAPDQRWVADMTYIPT